MSQGWISVHRSLLDHPFWGSEKFTKAQAWIDLILNANHKENRVMIKGQFIDVARGQQIRSQVTLAKIWGWDRKTVHRFLKLLENDSMIVQHSTHLTTIITICKYNDFQDKDKISPHPKGQVKGQEEGQAVPSERGINNNDNNEDNENNNNKKPKAKKSSPKIEMDYTCWPYLPEQQVFDDWLSMRKAKKALVSQTVVNQFGKKLHAAVSLGYTVDECIAECVTRSWIGFEIKWMENSKKSNNGSVNRSQQIEEINKQAGEDWLNGR